MCLVLVLPHPQCRLSFPLLTICRSLSSTRVALSNLRGAASFHQPMRAWLFSHALPQSHSWALPC